ncbi:MAG: response regulator [Candidatus Viridilinea halotolerans]|uniref:Response regulator n=1 Tax=Candidatus Viridilinea halotolerans TaxID=2491704 RepID=A0A426U6W7_9CHLR|nr:MAG: response regulator [Candidatus Viridilinea halotolerans]
MQIVIASANVFRRDLSSTILNAAGYTCTEVRNVAALFTHLHETQFDLILIDYQIDETEPTRLLKLLRQQTQAPLVWMAEHIQALRLTTLDQGNSLVLAWPFQIEQLLQSVTTLIGQSGASRAMAATAEARNYLE